ncbi:MAG: MarR family transcriptional regulator [Candidatus Thorarchaeota archaeon]|nr:MarR family transcriptional regulator [Candidatus Thorarchaeota archaeon]
MSQISNNERNEIQISRVLQVGAQWLGLQRTAGTIMAVLYRKESSEGLSVKEISNASKLSPSTVSSVSSHLESLGILMRRTNAIQQRRGRRKSVFVMCVGIHDILKMGIKRKLEQINRISLAIDQTLDSLKHSDPDEYATIAQAADEINLFLSNRNW